MARERPTALLIIDLQRDFCAGGALAVPNAERVLPPINALIDQLGDDGAVYASRDWHPATTSHFSDGGGDWPVHCVAGTTGAAFHPGLRLPPATVVVSKGQAPDADGYSAFEGSTPAGDLLEDDLRRHGIVRLVVAGLATDYCVRSSVLDARRRGFEVAVVTDAVAGVEATTGDSARALADMARSGATLLSADELLAPRPLSSSTARW